MSDFHTLIIDLIFISPAAGVNAILYYAPTIFTNLGLTGNAVPLLATGVVGIVYAEPVF